MRYFVMEDGNLFLKETASLPKDLESLYQSVREKYTIAYHLSDWADDDTDAGWGYCYDNSYSFHREPYREEMIIENGELVGFYVGSISKELEIDRILPLKQDASVYTRDTYSPHYSARQEWVLHIEETPAPSGYVYLVHVPHEDKDKQFLPMDFSEELIEAVAEQRFIEDTRGHFDGASRLKLKLTEEAMQDPDRVLAYFKEHHPVMVRQ